MRPFCPGRFYLLVAVVAVFAALSCGALGGDSSPTATPTRAESIGLEIAETYDRLMLQARLIVEPRPAAPEAKERLRLLGEEYRVRIANYACLRDSLNEAEQAEIAASFDASLNRGDFLPADMTWFEDAASDYDLEDAAIRQRLEDIETLHDYAFLERVARSRPGQELLCGG